MWDSTPWAVDGAIHSAEVARLLAHAATAGFSGIITPGDLKVSALAVPGSKVRVAPGGVLVPSSYSGARQQTYVARNATETESEAFGATSSSARSDLVVVRVEDRKYEGQPLTPEQAATFQFVRTEIIRGVPSSTTTAEALNLPYPAYALARVNIPASTATITNAMIVDLRNLASPHSLRRIFNGMGIGGLAISNEASWGTFPGYQPTVEVPVWATHATVLGTMEGVNHVHPATVGEWRLLLGNKTDTPLYYDLSALPDSGTDRVGMTAIGNFVVTDVAGTTQRLSAQGKRSGYSGFLATRSGTHMIFDVQFEQRAV
jgi:hypothetical protein